MTFVYSPENQSLKLVCFSRPLHILQIDAFLRHLVQRRKSAQTLDGFNDAVGHVIDFGSSVEAADAEADRTVRQVVAGAQSLQYIRWLKRRGGACRTAGNCDVVNAHQQRLAFHVSKADVQVAGQAMLHGAVDVSLIQAAHDAVAQTIAQARQLHRFARQLFRSDGTGFAQADDAGDIQRPGAHAALVAAAVNDGGNLHPRIFAANIQSADTLGPVHFVPRDRHQVDILFSHIDRNLADSLRGVGVEDDAAFATQLANLGERLQHPDLVVRGHDRHQDRLVVHGALQVFEIDQAIFLHRHIGDAIAIFFQALAGVEHRLVLGDRGDDVVVLLAIPLGHALDGEVVALGGTRGEDNLFGGGADQLRNALASCFYAFFACPAERVIAAGGVAELLHEIRQYLL